MSSPITTELRVSGMTCNNCARHVTEAIQGVAGVQSASVSLQNAAASVRWVSAEAKNVPEVLTAISEAGYAAKEISEGSEDAVIRMIRHGLSHAGKLHSSMLGALQLAAGFELKRAGRFLTVMDTLVTLAPLLGLLGTVTGLMRAFLNIGSAELSVTAVTGGIGEALIATACGLGIAIFALIPFNYFSARVTQMQFDLETAATNVEVMVGGGKAGDSVYLHKPTSPGQATSH